jgi:hypothetical protein
MNSDNTAGLITDSISERIYWGVVSSRMQKDARKHCDLYGKVVPVLMLVPRHEDWGSGDLDPRILNLCINWK